ncbi:hypothetical protein TWF281_007801 [Arthrobotrys megalospora]
MEVVQFLLWPEDSAIVVENVYVRPYKGILKSPLFSLPMEIHLLILEYLDDFSVLSLAVASRLLYNITSERLQNIICPLAELGCWAGKPLVRAGVVLETGDEFSATNAEMDVTGGRYLMAVIEAKMLGLRERGYHTIYDSDDPERLEILRSIAGNSHIPQVVRRYVAAVLNNSEYENMFQEGKQYLIRNLDKMEYVPFPTGKVERTTARPPGVYDDTLVSMPHTAERVIEAITWSPTTARNTSPLGQGAWAGNRIDLISEARAEFDGWRLL